MKIAICGASGVGKSTLLDVLFKDESSFVCTTNHKKITSVIRDLVKSGKITAINEEMSGSSQYVIWKSYKEIFENTSNYISDRSLVDILAYTKTTLDMIDSHSEKYQELSRAYFKMLREFEDFMENNRDVVYLYIPIEFEISGNEFRSNNQDYHKSVDASIKEHLDTLKIPYKTICGDVNERANRVGLAVLGSIMHL